MTSHVKATCVDKQKIEHWQMLDFFVLRHEGAAGHILYHAHVRDDTVEALKHKCRVALGHTFAGTADR